MDSQAVWIFLHVLLLVYWLGADIGVFYSSLQVIKQENSPETRAAIVKVLSFINNFPATSSILMLPVGLQLAAGVDASPVTGFWLVLVWIGAFAWLGVAHSSTKRRGTPLGKRLSDLDLVVRIALIAVLGIAAIASFAGGDPFSNNWVALKVLLYAYVLACGLGIRFAFAPFGPAFGRYMAQGSTPEIEAALRRPVMMVKPFVLALWGGLVVMALIGIAQPQF